MTYTDYNTPSAADSKRLSLLCSFDQLPLNFYLNIQEFFLHLWSLLQIASLICFKTFSADSSAADDVGNRGILPSMLKILWEHVEKIIIEVGLGNRRQVCSYHDIQMLT